MKTDQTDMHHEPSSITDKMAHGIASSKSAPRELNVHKTSTPDQKPNAVEKTSIKTDRGPRKFM